jgi:hypothetical protein
MTDPRYPKLPVGRVLHSSPAQDTVLLMIDVPDDFGIDAAIRSAGGTLLIEVRIRISRRSCGNRRQVTRGC